MADDIEFGSKTIANPGMSPVEAYARLASYEYEFASFLLESRRPDDAAGRYSIVGYRTWRGSVFPPGGDAFAEQLQKFAEVDRPEKFAVAVSQAATGFASSSGAFRAHGIPLFEDEGPAGYFVRTATVLVFDHKEDTIIAAGPVPGNGIERILWEFQNAPPMRELPSLVQADPSGLKAVLPPKKLMARGKRAKGFLDDELASVVLSQTLLVPAAATDPLDVYRSWRGQHDAAYGYYFDFVESPMAPRLVVLGFSDEVLHHQRHGEAKVESKMRDHLPHGRMHGEPRLEAARTVRRLEESSRQVWGGAVGYIAPGGASSMVLADPVVSMQNGSYWLTEGLDINPETDVEALPGRAREQAQKPLRAIATAAQAAADRPAPPPKDEPQG